MTIPLQSAHIQAIPNLTQTVSPSPVEAPELAIYSQTLAQTLGISKATLTSPSTLEQLSGNAQNYHPSPIATVYSGHQFGVYVPQLGDGRALLLGDYLDPQQHRWEIQLKGSGKTPYSRFADGRAVWRSSIREFIASEALHALNIPTTRALALILSPSPVYRELPEQAAILTRVAPSFLRFGHLQYCYQRRQTTTLNALFAELLTQHYPECQDAANPHLALFQAISQRTISLVAQWQAIGFIHSVMNTDNMSLLGLTIDYGPYAFLNAYQPHYTPNHSDSEGRYAYQEQPYIAQWNLLQLAAPFLEHVSESELIDSLNQFVPQYQAQWLKLMRAKLGLIQEEAQDEALIHQLLSLMKEHHADYTLTFRALATITAQAPLPTDLGTPLYQSTEFAQWRERYQQRLQREPLPDAIRQAQMNQSNPCYIPRTHLLQEAIAAAEETHDFTPLHQLHQCLQNPYQEQSQYQAYAQPAPDWANEIALSCSS